MTTELVNERNLYLNNNDYIYLKKNRDPYIKFALLIIASVATIFIFLIIIFLFSYGGSFFLEVSLYEFLFSTNWLPSSEQFGAFPIIIGTFLVSFGSIIIAVPIGLATAIFIAEIAPPKLRKALKFTIEILAGIPSIVFGFFGIMVINVFIRDFFQNSNGYTWLSGSLILAMMSLPTIVSVCEDAIRAVPDYYREGSYAMGATKWQTIRHVVIPASISGITAAIILGIGRALGETMAMMLVIGNCKRVPDPITNLFACIATITSTIGLGWGPTAQGSIQQRAYVALGIMLFIMTFIINTTAVVLLSKTKRKFKGEVKKNRFPKISQRKEFQFLKNYRRSIIILVVAVSILLFFLDLGSKVITLTIWILLSSALYLMRRVSQKNKKLILYVILLSFMGWVFFMWWGLVNSIFLCVLIFSFILLVRRLSSVTQQNMWLVIISLCTFLSLTIVFMIVSDIVIRGLPIITRPGYFTTSPLEGGIYPALVGTIQLTVGSLCFALPLGVCAGIYLSEYSKDSKITKIIRSGIDNLNGTPSIVFGLFGFVFFVIFLEFGRSLLAGSLTLGLMILPTIIRTTEEAVRAIPQSFREGSLALGSSKWQGITKIVLPAAAPGIVTGAVLGMGRSAGETAPIMFTAAKATGRWITTDIFRPVMALTYYLLRLLIEIPGGYSEAPGVALTLLLLILVFYSITFVIRSIYEKKKQW